MHYMYFLVIFLTALFCSFNTLSALAPQAREYHRYSEEESNCYIKFLICKKAKYISAYEEYL